MKKSSIVMIVIGALLCVASVVLSLVSFANHEFLQLTFIKFPYLISGIPFAGGVVLIYFALENKMFARRLAKVLFASGVIIISLSWAVDMIRYFAGEPTVAIFAGLFTAVWQALGVYLLATALSDKPVSKNDKANK